MNSTTLLSAVYAANALMAFAAAAVMWRKRQSPAAMPMGLVLAAAACWALCDAIQLQVPPESRRFVVQAQYIAIVSCAPLFFHAAMVLSGRAGQLTTATLLTMWAVPVASLLLAWTNDWHRWVWADIQHPSGTVPFVTYRHGWWYWVLTAYSYVLMTAGTVVLVRAVRVVSRGFRPAMVMMLMAILLPWAGNLANNLGLGPSPGLNWLSLTLGLSAWLAVWVVFREGLLDLLPQARDVIIELMGDGVMVLDRSGRIIFANHIARNSFLLTETVLLAAMDVPSLNEAPVDWRGEAPVDGRDRRRWLDLRVGPIFDRWGSFAGRIVVARDVTLQKELEDERERLIDELQEALGRVTQLEGLLPVCAGCHNVRDDQGAWKTMEDYIGSRTPVEFTHAICPDCAARLYPDLAKGRTAS